MPMLPATNMPSYLTVINGQAIPNGGTSAAVPVVAAIMALLNDARFRAGKPAIGFANPWLYSLSSGINDITDGSVVGCAGVDLQNGLVIAGAGIIPYASWNATVGWDPATGLGTPNFGVLKELALQVPGRGSHWHGPHGY
nr:tripeptidyl-peptidase sed4 [Quercus suber]